MMFDIAYVFLYSWVVHTVMINKTRVMHILKNFKLSSHYA